MLNRKNQRYEADLEISILMVPDRGNPELGIETKSYRAKDVSKDGVGFSTFDEITEGAFVRVDIPISKHPAKSVSLSGIIRRTEHSNDDARNYIAIEFFQLPKDPEMLEWWNFIDRKVSAR